MFKFHTARALTTAILALALTMSFLHIAELFGLMGAGWEQWAAPFLIDTVAIIGKIASGPEFTAATRRRGRHALYVAGSVSLVANVTVGYVNAQYGSAVLGAIVVIVALWGEGMISHLRPTAAARTTKTTTTRVNSPKAPKVTAPADTAKADTAKAEIIELVQVAERAKRSAAAKRAAATRAANKVNSPAATPVTAPAAELTPTYAYI